MTTATDIRNALRLRFPSNSHALLWEVAETTGAGASRFADAVAFGLWPSHGFMVDGIEIKVSRGDFAKEMAQPEKSHAVMRYCHRWWLATPKGLVKPEELPPGWGLLELNGDGVLRQRVAARRLIPEAMSMGFIASLLRRRAGMDEDMTRCTIEAAVAKGIAADESRRMASAAETVRRSLGEAEKVVTTARSLEAAGIDLASLHNGLYGDKERVEAAMRLALALVKREDYGGLLERLDKAVGAMLDVRSTFSALIPDAVASSHAQDQQAAQTREAARVAASTAAAIGDTHASVAAGPEGVRINTWGARNPYAPGQEVVTTGGERGIIAPGPDDFGGSDY